MCGSSVQSNPAATVVWNDNFGRTVSIADARFHNDSLLSLSVSELTLADAGVWTCAIMVAGVGMVRHSIELVVVGKFVRFVGYNGLKSIGVMGNIYHSQIHVEYQQ